MATRVSVIDMVVGQTYANVYILKQHAIKQTKQGTNYIDLVLQDKTGEMPGKLWTIPPSLNLDNLQDSDYIVLQFSVEDYQGNKQAKILNIREVKETDKFDKNDLIPVAPEPVEKMYDELINTAQGFNSTPLKKVVTTALKENKEVLLTMPGAKSVHHAVLGGLLLHTCGMLRTAKAIASVYPTVRKEVLYAGVIIHDIAKIKEFQTGPIGLVTDYSTSGKLLGHIHMGAKYIGDLCEKLDIDPEISTILQHMILSHHGIPEHGSAVTPMFLEAELLHLCDRIDSRVYIYNEAVKDTPVGEFSSKVFALDNKQIYNFKWDENDGLNTDLDDDGLY